MKEGGTVFMLASFSCPACLERSIKREGKGEIRIQGSGLCFVSLNHNCLLSFFCNVCQIDYILKA